MNTLKFCRLERGFTQFEVSLGTNIPPYKLSRIESGELEPTAEEQATLATFYGTSPEALLDEVRMESTSGREEVPQKNVIPI